MGKKNDILMAVCKAENMRPQDVLGKSRLASVSRVRKILYAALRYAGFSTTIIQDFVGRDHSTIAYGCERMADSDKNKALGILEQLGIEAYEFSQKNGKRPVYSRNAAKIAKKRMIEVLEPDYREGICKYVWREVA